VFPEFLFRFNSLLLRKARLHPVAWGVYFLCLIARNDEDEKLLQRKAHSVRVHGVDREVSTVCG